MPTALLKTCSLPLASAHLARGLEGGGKGARFPAAKLAASLQARAYRQQISALWQTRGNMLPRGGN